MNHPVEASTSYGLRLLGDPILQLKAQRIVSAAAVPAGLVDALHREMKRFRGLGMAAQQVGSRASVALVTIDKVPRVMLNPRITSRSSVVARCIAEGCLSVPGFRTSTRRHVEITVDYEDITFKTCSITLKGTNAQVVQHEIDHLNGVCIADNLPRPQRRQAERLVAKYQEVTL